MFSEASVKFRVGGAKAISVLKWLDGTKTLSKFEVVSRSPLRNFNSYAAVK